MGPDPMPPRRTRSPLEWGAVEGESPVGVSLVAMRLGIPSTVPWIWRGNLGDTRHPTLNTPRVR